MVSCHMTLTSPASSEQTHKEVNITGQQTTNQPNSLTQLSKDKETNKTEKQGNKQPNAHTDDK